MRKRKNIIFFLLFLVLFFAGCNREEQLYFEETKEIEGVEADTQSSEFPIEEQTVCYVYLCGAVMRPGVYELPSGSRIYEVIELAGGLSESAAENWLNQAELVVDGQKIYVPTEQEAIVEEQGAQADPRININEASVEELMSLTGIGASRAEAIVAYRNEKGQFASIEEIMNVAGIKDGLYSRIKDDIRVK